MRRLAAVAATLALVLTACTGGPDDETSQRKGEDGPSLPLPAKAPTARGPATGPALEPKVLLAASDDLEEMAGSLESSSVERRAGAFVSGRTVVGYSVDDISGYDLASGEQKWTADLDVGTGGICFVSEPDRAVKTFTVAYGASITCPGVATIRVSDGKVLSTSDKLTELGAEFEGEPAGGSVRDVFTLRGQDHLLDSAGVVWKMVKGQPEAIARLEDDSYFQLAPTPKGDTLIGARLSDRGRCRVDGYALPSFKHLWTQDNKALFPEVRRDCIISAAPRSSSWLMQQAADRYHLVQVDPATGEVLGRDDAPSLGNDVSAGEFDVTGAALHFDQALGLPDGDTIFAQSNGLTRHSLKTGKVVWDLDLGQVELESDEEFPTTTVLPQGVTADGYLVASVSNATAAEVIAVEVRTGKLVARWAVPKEYRNGFQVDPGMTLSGDGVVLTRNFEAWRRAYADYLDRKEPEGDMYDIGVFTFPAPDSSTARTVPTTGPTDHDAKALGGIAAPEGSSGDRGVGAISTGSRVVAHAGNVVTGLDPRTGKQDWTLQLDESPKARVCAAGEPDQPVKTVTIAYSTGGKDPHCGTLLRIDAADGSVTERIELPRSRAVSRLVVHERVVHVVTDDRTVSRIEDGTLVREAGLARQPYQLERTPEDPSLLISTAQLKGGRDWAVDAYRLPGFEQVWSTTGRKVLKKIDSRNMFASWRGNGLWLSSTNGDLSDPEARSTDSLVALDPATGEVAARTGAVKRDHLADDLKKFSLTNAISSAHVTVGFEDGDVVLPQKNGIMRYSLKDDAVRWATDTESIMGAMEKDRYATAEQQIDLVDGGKTLLVTLSNDVSVEAMTLDASSGKITGRWNVPAKARNGLQASPEVTAYDGGFALSHSYYAWEYAFGQVGREVPPERRYDIGLFSLTKPKKE